RTECHTRKRGADLARDAANAVGGRHFRVEGLELGRSAEEEQEDNRFAGGDRLAPGSQGAGAKKVRQGQAAQTEPAHAEEFPARITGPAVEEGKHGRLLRWVAQSRPGGFHGLTEQFLDHLTSTGRQRKAIRAQVSRPAQSAALAPLRIDVFSGTGSY